MASRLPLVPRVVFTILEPISLIGGWAGATFYPDWFINEQFVSHSPVPSSNNAKLVALQLGNVYGLLFLAAVAVLYTTTELKVVRNYLIALWIADIGHIAICYFGLGYYRFMAVDQWNAMTWGNVGATAALCLTRTAYLLGLFGPDAPPDGPKKSD
ncbi:hypothetical protein NKR23_g1826 [Pleurostoma richardsiae]|uniref:DUF7704 domain-containing protein n=1 Tax=Pleurostoma richardsiae TaxID=41990 RepID=A0AA38S968_9PEZI|nr:hypothetical protein NKR23_g1826 [Pleurostoma richardsiae]